MWTVRGGECCVHWLDGWSHRLRVKHETGRIHDDGHRARPFIGLYCVVDCPIDGDGHGQLILSRNHLDERDDCATDHNP